MLGIRTVRIPIQSVLSRIVGQPSNLLRPPAAKLLPGIQVAVLSPRRCLQGLANPSNPASPSDDPYAVEDDPDYILEQKMKKVPGNLKAQPRALKPEEERLNINSIAPNFKANTTHGEIDLWKYIQGPITMTTTVENPGNRRSTNTHLEATSTTRGTTTETTNAVIVTSINSASSGSEDIEIEGKVETASFTAERYTLPGQALHAEDTEGHESPTPRHPVQKEGEGSWVLFFSHPGDFTPVCTTEIAAITKLQDEFYKRGVKLLGLSIDPVELHLRWRYDVEDIVRSNSDRARPSFHAGLKSIAGRLNDKVPGQMVPGRIHLTSADRGKRILKYGGGPSNTGKIEEDWEDLGDLIRLPENTRKMYRGAPDVGTGGMAILDSAFPKLPYLASYTKQDFGKFPHFPIVADETGQVARLYGMLEDLKNPTQRNDSDSDNDIHYPKGEIQPTVRSLFVIDPKKRIRAIMTYPASTGRNTAEILRVIDALQETDRTGAYTGANWTDGDELIIPPEISTEKAKSKFPGRLREVTPYLRYISMDMEEDW